MKNKKKITVPVILIIVFVILYTIFCVLPTRVEIQLLPKWTLNLSETEVVASKDKTLVPFRLGSTAGYFTLDGQLSYAYDVSERCSISDSYFVRYNDSSTSFNIMNADGSSAVKIDSAGFPYLQEDRLFVFAPGGNSVSAFDYSGNRLYQYQGYSPITDFSSSTGGCVIGFADGEIRVLDNDKTSWLSAYPMGSDYQVIYGVDVSDSGEFVACISGYDKQRFVLYKKVGSQLKPVFHEYYDDQRITTSEVYFTKDSNYVYYNSENHLGIVDCKKFKSKRVPLDGKVLKFAEIPELDVICILTRNNENCKITFIEKTSNIVGEYTFAAKNVFVSSYENLLFVGSDDEIACLEVVRR